MDAHSSIFRVIKGATGAHLDAGRIGAVHAAVLPEEPLEVALVGGVFLKADQSPGVPLEIRRIL
jgi:hypothetical protein